MTYAKQPLSRKQKKACEELSVFGFCLFIVILICSSCAPPLEEQMKRPEAGVPDGAACALPPSPRRPDVCERCSLTCGDAGVRRCSHNNGTSEENCECK